MKHLLKSFLFISILIMFNCNPNGDNGSNGTPDEENPVPSLNAISPNSKVSHLPSFTLTVTGNMFIQSSRIIFNGAEKQTTYVSSSELKCQIEPEDITGSQSRATNNLTFPQVHTEQVPVLVNNPSPGGGDSNSINFTLYDNYEFRASKNISNYSEGRSSTPTILTDSNGNAMVIWDDTRLNTSEIFFSRTTDRGINWSEPQNITHYDPYPSWQNTTVIDKNDSIYLVWESKIQTAGTYYAYISKSTNDGQSWSEAKKIPGSQHCYRPRVAIDDEGNLYVVWDRPEFPGLYEIYFTRSLDNGNSWSNPVNLSKNPNRSEYVDIVTNKNGRIYVVWFDNFLDERFIYFTRSTNRGQSWSTVKQLGSVSKERPMYPKIACEGNEYVYLFWYDEITQDGPQEIFFRKSTDGGTTWGQKKNLTNNELSSFSPFVTLDRIGNLNLVWCEDDTNDASSIYFSRSINRGDSWTAPVRLTNYASGSYKPAIAVDNECNIFVTWHNKKNNSEVFATASK